MDGINVPCAHRVRSKEKKGLEIARQPSQIS
jgi:hypothetical protein